MQQNNIKSKAEKYLRREMIKFDLLNGQNLNIERVIEKLALSTALAWLKTGHVNSICDAIKAVDIFRLKADIYKAQAEIQKNRGDSSGWIEEYAEREQMCKWMAQGLMDAIRKADSV